MPSLNMPNINQVALSGRLVQNPDFRFVENGNCTPARTDRRQSHLSRSQRRMARRNLLRRYRALAESRRDFFSAPIQRDADLFATGRLQSHSWRDDEDRPHSRIEVPVRNLQIIEKSQESTDGEGVDTKAALQPA